MSDESFPRPDVRADRYIGSRCPNCDRVRLEIYVDGPEDDPRVVGIACEKCGAQWLLDPTTAGFFGDLSDDNPLRPPAADEDFGLERRSQEKEKQMTAERIGETCISCRGSGLTGFFGVATIPCWRCGGSGRDPHPGAPYPEPKVYSWISEGRQGADS